MKKKQVKKKSKGGSVGTSAKRSFNKFEKRTRVSRSEKERRRDSLMDAVRAAGIDPSGVRLRDSFDGGRAARLAPTARKDERTVRGVFHSARGGFGFVTPEEGEERDIYIPEGRLSGAVDRDIVECVYHFYRDGTGEVRTEGRVTRIVEQVRDSVVGRVCYESGYRVGRRHYPPTWWLEPDDSRLNLRVRLTALSGARDGEKVVARLDRRTAYGGAIDASVTAVLGDADSKEANYRGILIESGIPLEFSEEELALAEELSREMVGTEGRRDLRDRIIFTMDSDTAKDLDDAVSVTKLKDGWVLSVHIADVSHYIPRRSVLERMAINRGTSVYFTDKVVPMLPPCLSNGACSLNAGEDRYAVSAHMRLSREGELISTSLEPTVIRSRVKGVYAEINTLLAGEGGSELKKKYREVMPALKKMEELYGVLLAASRRRGALELEIPEPEIILDGEGMPTDILVRERGVAERMIEQFMLIANEGVARLLGEGGMPCVYRVHSAPDGEKLDECLQRCRNMGLESANMRAEEATPARISALLSEAEERGLLPVVSYGILRSMARAEYSVERSGHYGLGLKHYCHFTSPIRRLSDLAVHRIIRETVFEKREAVRLRSFAGRCAAAATDTEQRAVAAERRIADMYKAIYMSEHLGEQMEGCVSGITSFGAFVRLDNTVEGLVPMDTLPGLFVYDEGNLSLRCRDTLVRMGDRVRVRVDEVNISGGRITFALLL